MIYPDLIAIGGFIVLFALLLLRVPIGAAMGLVGVGGFALMVRTGPALNLVGLSPIRTATEYSLALIPMFILMGSLATASGLSAELYRASNAWIGHRRGGLAMATIAATANTPTARLTPIRKLNATPKSAECAMVSPK